MRIGADILGVVGVAACLWINKMYSTFSYDGKRKLSKTIVEGVAEYIDLPDGGVGLDIKTPKLIQFNYSTAAYLQAG